MLFQRTRSGTIERHITVNSGVPRTQGAFGLSNLLVIRRAQCLLVLTVALVATTIAPSSAAQAAAAADGKVSAHVAGACTRDARYTIHFKRADGRINVRFEVTNARRGTRWRYRLYVRAAGETYRDHSRRMTAVFGYWGTEYIRLGRTGHHIEAKVRAESFAGQLCGPVTLRRSW